MEAAEIINACERLRSQADYKRTLERLSADFEPGYADPPYIKIWIVDVKPVDRERLLELVTEAVAAFKSESLPDQEKQCRDLINEIGSLCEVH